MQIYLVALFLMNNISSSEGNSCPDESLSSSCLDTLDKVAKLPLDDIKHLPLVEDGIVKSDIKKRASRALKRRDFDTREEYDASVRLQEGETNSLNLQGVDEDDQKKMRKKSKREVLSSAEHIVVVNFNFERVSERNIKNVKEAWGDFIRNVSAVLQHRKTDKVFHFSRRPSDDR